jgi:hypothetical protein
MLCALELVESAVLAHPPARITEGQFVLLATCEYRPPRVPGRHDSARPAPIVPPLPPSGNRHCFRVGILCE